MNRNIGIIIGAIVGVIVIITGGLIFVQLSSPQEQYISGIVLTVDGEEYYFSGPVVGENGERDVPGHQWLLQDANSLLGKHYNTGPDRAANWWSSEAKDGALLFDVEAIIDIWSIDKAIDYKAKGFVHYHELIKVSDGSLHPSKVIWLKHIAVTSFNLDGGPHPEMAHQVTPGVDTAFMPNANMPYTAGKEYIHGIELTLDGEGYYFAGAPDGPNGEVDVPGHDWVAINNSFLYGLHYNTGPFNESQWWSSDAEDGTLLFVVEAIIDTWSTEKATAYAEKGFVHYHELVKVANTSITHLDKVVWLKHYAVLSFNFDGGPHPEMSHQVTPGIDTSFMPNYNTPYPS